MATDLQIASAFFDAIAATRGHKGQIDSPAGILRLHFHEVVRHRCRRGKLPCGHLEIDSEAQNFFPGFFGLELFKSQRRIVEHSPVRDSLVARVSMNGWTMRFANPIPPRSLESGEIGNGAVKIWTWHIRDPIGAYMRSRPGGSSRLPTPR